MASKNDSTVKSDDKSSSGQLARGQLSSGENPRKSVEREPKPEADAADEPEWEDSNFVFDGERLRDRSSIVLKNEFEARTKAAKPGLGFADSEKTSISQESRANPGAHSASIASPSDLPFETRGIIDDHSIEDSRETRQSTSEEESISPESLSGIAAPTGVPSENQDIKNDQDSKSAQEEGQSTSEDKIISEENLSSTTASTDGSLGFTKPWMTTLGTVPKRWSNLWPRTR